jgi:peptide/nickel transport system substrate-binding protein
VKRGRILRTRIEFAPSSGPHWDILRGPINSAYPIFQPVLSSLVQLNMENGQIDPDLAESWTFSADGKQITFNIRQGVTWHDGTPLKAADLKSNFDVMILGTLGYTSHFKALLGAADSSEAPDDATLRINLKQPSNSMFRTMTHGVMLNYAPHVPRADVEKGKVIGTNAYTWSSNSATKIEERKYAKYWAKGVDGQPLPYLDGIDWNVILDTALHLAAFRTGQIDAFDHINATALVGQIDTIKRDIPNLVTGVSSDSWRMILIKNKAPFTNIAVRRALQIGLDREAFAASALRGSAIPAGYVASPKGYGGSWGPTLADQQKLLGLNPATRKDAIAEAERLLTSAGFTASSPLKVTMVVVSGGVFADEAVAAASLLNQVKGLQIDVKSEESAVHNRRLVVPGGDFELLYRPFAQAIDDLSQTVGLFWISTGSRNYGEWKDAEVDAWYAEQESTTNAARRTELVNQIQQKLWDQAYNIVLAWASTPWVLKPELKGVFLGGSFSNRGRYDKAWLDRT